MRLNPKYKGVTPFDTTCKVRFRIALALKGLSILLGLAVVLVVVYGGLYLTFVHEDFFYIELFADIVRLIIVFSDVPIFLLIYYANELILHAWADRYYARIEILEQHKTNREREAHSTPNKATLVMLYIAGFLFSPNERDAAQGDMEEQFNSWKKKFGTFGANCYLAYDICCTFVDKCFTLVGKIAPAIKWFVKAVSITSLVSGLIWLINQLEFVRNLWEYIFHR